MFGISFFVCLVFLGPFFIVNLFLAVLKIKFADSAKKDDNAQKKAEMHKDQTEEEMIENKRRRYSGKEEGHHTSIFAEEGDSDGESIDPHAVKETLRLPPAGAELETSSASGDRGGPVSEAAAVHDAVSSSKDADGGAAANDSQRSVGSSFDVGASVKKLFTTSRSTKVRAKASVWARHQRNPHCITSHHLTLALTLALALTPNQVRDEQTFEQILARRPRIARDIYWFVQHENFNTFFLLAIGFNTACLSLDRFDMSDSLEGFLETSNLVLTLLFLFELVLKMVGLTPRYYFKDSFNCFDFVIVMISLVRSCSQPPALTISPNPNPSCAHAHNAIAPTTR